MLSEALIDISKELKKLSLDKKVLEKEMNKIVDSLRYTEETEATLREKISRLVAKENQLIRKREEIHTKVNAVKEKVNKVRKIKEELTDF